MKRLGARHENGLHGDGPDAASGRSRVPPGAGHRRPLVTINGAVHCLREPQVQYLDRAFRARRQPHVVEHQRTPLQRKTLGYSLATAGALATGLRMLRAGIIRSERTSL